MALLLSLVLRGGVLLAALLVLTGGLWELAARGAEPVAQVLASPPGPGDWSPLALVFRAARGEALALVQLGLEVLVLTPVARVALSLVLFAREGDWLYAGVALWVLGLLGLSLLGII
jgi:uncharacterized membrane protein